MTSFPGPRHEDQADEVEQRRRALKKRFRRVSASMDGRDFSRATSHGSGTGLSSFEWAIGLGVALFLIAVASMALH